MADDAAAADSDDGFDDYTLATPWERLVAALEEKLQEWMAAGPVALTAASEPAAEGGAALRAAEALVPYFLPTHTQAFRLTLFFPARADAAGAAADDAWAPPPSGAPPPPPPGADPFPAGAHSVTRRFGVCEFLLLSPARASGVCLDADEAAAACSALACARAGAGAPWPGFVPVHDPSRRSLRGVATSSAGVATRYEADAVAASRAATWLASPTAQVGLLARRIASALPPPLAAAAATPELFAAAADATFAVRAYYDLPLPADAAAAAAATRRGDDSDEDNADDAAAAQRSPRRSAPPGRRRFGLYLIDWDEGAPWAPWVSLAPPFAGLQLAATWRDVAAGELLAAETEGRLQQLLSPEAAHAWTLRAEPTAGGATVGARNSVGGSAVADDDDAGDGATGGDDARRGSLGGMLHGLVAAMRAAAGADSQGALASGEHWDVPSATASAAAAAAGGAAGASATAATSAASERGSVPRAPPEHVLQDVLRDVFEALPLPPALGGGAPRSSGSTIGLLPPATPPGCAAFCPPPARSCPPASLLARVALHALAFGNARAVALLWQRVVREIRFMYWERGVPLPRMDADSATADGVPDFSACLMHQKLQLLNICIARRSEDAAAAARAAAEAREAGRDEAGGSTPPARSRAREAHERRAAAEAAAAKKGWEQGWEGDDDDGWADAADVAAGGASPAPLPPPQQRGSDDEEAAHDEDSGFVSASEGKGGGGASDAEEQPVSPVAAPASPAAPQAAADVAAAAEGDGPTCEVGTPRGVAGPLPYRLLRWPHARAHAPRTQRPPALTEDALRAREAALAALADAPDGAAARQRLQADTLLSDMCAFKAANLHQGGGVLADFVRWHSPRDWLAEDQDEGLGPELTKPATNSNTSSGNSATDATTKPAAGAGRMGALSVARAPTGRLSARMAAPGNLWATLWAEARPAAAAEQKALQDPVAAGESVLHWMETLAPADLFASLLAAAAAAAGALLASSPAAGAPSADAALRDAAATAAAVLARPCPYPEEWRTMCDALAVAEAVAARAEWLHRRLPHAPLAAHALLAQSLASTAAPEAELPASEREALVAAALRGADGGEHVAAHEYLLCAATPGPGGMPLRHRLHATVAPGHAAVAVAVAAPEP